MTHDRISAHTIEKLEQGIVRNVFSIDLSKCHQFDDITDIRISNWNHKDEQFGVKGPIETLKNVNDFNWFGEFRLNAISPNSFWTVEFMHYEVNIGGKPGKLIRLNLTQEPQPSLQGKMNHRGISILRLDDQVLTTYYHPDFGETNYLQSIGSSPSKIHPFLAQITRDLAGMNVTKAYAKGIQLMNEAFSSASL